MYIESQGTSCPNITRSLEKEKNINGYPGRHYIYCSDIRQCVRVCERGGGQHLAALAMEEETQRPSAAQLRLAHRGNSERT